MRARCLSLGLSLGLSVALCVAPLSARAQSASQPEAVTSREAFDGRPDPERDTGDEVGRWVARILLAPLWLALLSGEELSRLILEPITTGAGSDGAEAPERLPISLMPVAQLETDRSFAGGLYAQLELDPVLVRLWGMHFDDRRLYAELDARVQPADWIQIRLEGDIGTRSDQTFHGLGWRAPNAAGVGYRHTRGGGRLSAAWDPDPAARISVATRLTHHLIDPPQNPSVQEAWTVVGGRLGLRLDTRERQPAAPGVGVGFAVESAGSTNRPAQWVTVTGRVGATVALSPEHDLTFGARFRLAEPLSDELPPFVELPSLGGTRAGDLAGFPRARLIGFGTAVSYVRYRWALRSGLDAAVFVEWGNAFGRGLSDLEVGRGRMSAGIQIETAGSDAHRVGLGAAAGSPPLVDGPGLAGGHVWLYVGEPP